jgi:cytochrome c553
LSADVPAAVRRDPGPRAPAPERIRRAQADRLLKAWEVPKGWRYWSSVNNQQVGIWYTAVTFAFFLFGGVLALLMRIQLAVPNNDFLAAETYNQVFTTHGSVMMFLFAIPIFEALAILIMPEMLGARDLPFPRLSAFGFWAFVIGGLFLCGSIFFDAAPRGGWFMYPPLTSTYQPDIGADIWLLGFSFIEVSAVAAAVELIVGGVEPPRPVRDVCWRCHGPDGTSSDGGGSPSLAGQRSSYLEAALRSFASRNRFSGTMVEIASRLSDDEIREISAYYEQLPRRIAPISPEGTAGGDTIATTGVVEREIPACVECHGPSAAPKNPAYPLLMGQHAQYLVLQLELLKQRRRGGSPRVNIMHAVVDRLTIGEIRAVARYYESISAFSQ